MFSRSPRRRRPFMGLVAGLVAGSVALGGGTAWAFWSASATATSAATTPKVAITQSSFPSLSATYINTITSLKNTGSFTVQNTGTVAGAVKVSIAGTGSLAGKLTAVIWPAASTATCTPAATVPAAPTSATGTWASLTLGSPTSLAPGAQQSYCVRTTVAGGASVADAMSLADVAGTLSSPATLTAELTAAGWTAADSAGIATQKTEAIYPLATDYRPDGLSDWYSVSTGTASTDTCLDVAQAGKNNGTAVNAYQCNQNDNQAFQITPVSETSPQAVTLRPMHAWDRNVALSGTTLVLATPDSASSAQRWVIQTMGGGRYQFVHAASGKCFNMSTSSMADCNQAGAAVYLDRKPITFITTNSGMDVSLPVRNVHTPLRFQFGSSFIFIPTWTTIGTTAAQNAPIMISAAPPLLGMSRGTEYPARLLLGSSGSADTQVAWTGTVRRAASGHGLSLTGGNG